MQCNYYVLDNWHVPVYMLSESVIKYYYYYIMIASSVACVSLTINYVSVSFTMFFNVTNVMEKKCMIYTAVVIKNN